MTHEEILSAIEDIKAEVHGMYGAHHAARLAQLDGALDTAAMAVQHLLDEEEREVDLAQRILNRATVHGNDEAKSPTERSMDEIRRIAGKAN